VKQQEPANTWVTVVDAWIVVSTFDRKWTKKLVLFPSAYLHPTYAAAKKELEHRKRVIAWKQCKHKIVKVRAVARWIYNEKEIRYGQHARSRIPICQWADHDQENAR